MPTLRTPVAPTSDEAMSSTSTKLSDIDSERATVCAAGAVAEHFGYFWVTKQPSHVVAEPVDVRDLEEAQ